MIEMDHIHRNVTCSLREDPDHTQELVEWGHNHLNAPTQQGDDA